MSRNKLLHVPFLLKIAIYFPPCYFNFNLHSLLIFLLFIFIVLFITLKHVTALCVVGILVSFHYFAPVPSSSSPGHPNIFMLSFQLWRSVSCFICLAFHLYAIFITYISYHSLSLKRYANALRRLLNSYASNTYHTGLDIQLQLYNHFVTSVLI